MRSSRRQPRTQSTTRNRSTAKQRAAQRQSLSKSFSRIFDNTPALVQRQIVEQALIPFLDTIPSKDAKRAIGAARRIAKRPNQVPHVDMTAKKSEINGLLDELTKDAKLSSRLHASKHETLVMEVVDSVAEWLNDLWSVTVEFGLDFPRVHSCLLFSMGVLDHVQGMKSNGCRCLFSTIYTPITIRDKSGKVLKEFNDVGLSNIESAILWVWRDILLALLASKISFLVKLVPELLAEIDDLIGWSGLERLVLGGVTYERKEDQQKGSYEELDYSRSRRDEKINRPDPDDEEENFYARHWNHKLVNQVPRFRRLVQQRMIEIFRAAPSASLYSSIIDLAPDDSASDQLLHILSWLAPASAGSISTALEIYSMENKPDEIASLLETHIFLLRPRDNDALREAVRTLAQSPRLTHRELALRICEKELVDTLHAFLHALHGPFSHIDTPQQIADLRDFLRMPIDGRSERVERWIDAASTPGMGVGNPMAVAAMMMGLPIPIPIPVPPPGNDGGAGNAAGVAAAAAALGDVEEMELIGMMDLDPQDSDFTDLREEYKPDFKGRFDGWVHTVNEIVCLATVALGCLQGGEDVVAWLMGGRKAGDEWIEEVPTSHVPPLILKIVTSEKKKSERILRRIWGFLWRLMPWIFGPDVVEEMVTKLEDKPSKLHICDGLESLSSFCETQKKNDWQEKRERVSALTLEQIHEILIRGLAARGIIPFPINAVVNGDGNLGEEGVQGPGSGIDDADGESILGNTQEDEIMGVGHDENYNDMIYVNAHFNNDSDDSGSGSDDDNDDNDDNDNDDDFGNAIGATLFFGPDVNILNPNHNPTDADQVQPAANFVANNHQVDPANTFHQHFLALLEHVQGVGGAPGGLEPVDTNEPMPALEPVPPLEPVDVPEAVETEAGTDTESETGSQINTTTVPEPDAAAEPELGGPLPFHYTLPQGYYTIDDLD